MKSFHCFQSTFIAILSFDPHNNPERGARETVLFPFWLMKRPLQASASLRTPGHCYHLWLPGELCCKSSPGRNKKHKTYWPDALLVFPDTFFPICPSKMFTHPPTFNCSMLLGCLFPYHTSESTLQTEYDTCNNHNALCSPFLLPVFPITLITFGCTIYFTGLLIVFVVWPPTEMEDSWG